MPERTYSEEEIARIIRRAAEIESGQLREQNATGDLPGLNLEELSKVAAEAGLDPENVRQAAHQLDQPESNQDELPSKNEVFAERWVDGKLTDELIDLVISDLNHRYSASHERKNWRDSILEYSAEEEMEKSSVHRTGQSVEWKFSNEYEGIVNRVLIQPRNEKIRIRVSKKAMWGADIDEDEFHYSYAVEYVSYVPYLAGVLALFSLPYTFLINLIAAILLFTVLQLTLVPGAKKLSGRLKESDSSAKEKPIDRYRREVVRVTEDLANLLSDPKKQPKQHSGKIELPDSETKAPDSEARARGDRERDRS